ncbi:glycosyltransferase [Nonomuraea ferruginea]
MAPQIESAGATVLCYDSAYQSVDLRKLEDDPLGLLSLFLDESAAMLRAAERLRDRPDLIVYDISILHAEPRPGKEVEAPGHAADPGVRVERPLLLPLVHLRRAGSGAGAARLGRATCSAGRGTWRSRTASRRTRPSCGGRSRTPTWSPCRARSSSPSETFGERFAFVGPCLGERAFLSGWEPPGDGLPVALLSFGTVASGRPDLVRTCVRAFAELPWHGVVTLGDGMDPAELGPLPPTIEVRRWVSHLRVLEHASVAVTHGGMGTAMEALYWGCPMVVVPATAVDRLSRAADRRAGARPGRRAGRADPGEPGRRGPRGGG